MSLTWADNNIEVYTEASGTLNFNDNDVKWAYVDWDDGENNSLEKAIYQWKELETDSNSVTLAHTYTKTGSFYPVIRTINSAGFISKYFYDASKTPTTIPQPQESVSDIGLLTVTDGKPLSTLKVENKIALSGIDNNVFGKGPLQVYIVCPALALGTTLDSAITMIFEIKAQVAVYDTAARDGSYETVIKTYTITGTLAQFQDNEATTGNPVCYTYAAGVPATPLPYERILNILSFKLKTPKLAGLTTATNNEFNKMRFFLSAKYPALDGDFYPIAYVSSGNPIKRLNDNRSLVKLDFSQSRAKASNTTISSYKYDTGKIFFEPLSRWGANGANNFTSVTQTSKGLKNINYTYTTRPDGLLASTLISGKKTIPFASGNDWFTSSTYTFIQDMFLFNDFNQLTPRYHLSRINSTANSSETSDLGTYEGVYRITPTISSSVAAPHLSGAFLDKQLNNKTAVYTTEAYSNADIVSSTPTLNQIGMDSWNTMPWENDVPKSEYLILANAIKTNKIFFNATPFASGMISDLSNFESGTTMGISYLRGYQEIEGDAATQTYEWVPLEFTDRTKVSRESRDASYESAKTEAYTEKSCSLAKSGFVEFDMPNDWAKVSISDLAFGIFNSGSVPLPGGGGAPDNAIEVSGAWVSLASDVNKLTVGTDQIFGATDYTEEIIGKYKYVYQVTGGTAGMTDNLMWIASGNSTTNEIFCPGSVASVSAGSVGSTTGYFRRINLYEVFDGAYPLDKNNGIPGHLAGVGDNYGGTFMFLSGAAAMATDLVSNFQDIYPLKIVLKGNHFEASSSLVPGLELWNILPANNSHSEIIKEIDDTAYDLNYMEITSDVNITYAGTYYQAISKGGKVFIQRTGTPIQAINFAGTAMGDEEQFSFSDDYTSYYTLYKLRKAEAQGVKVMWDEQQKDGTFVRFFGFATNISETHSVGGKRAPRKYTFTMAVQEICIIDELGTLTSDIEPLGGIKDARTF